jgi:hypothetical protein
MRTSARHVARRAITLKSSQAPASKRAWTRASPGKAKGCSGVSSRWSMVLSSLARCMPPPSSSVITRSMPEKDENGPSLATAAMLTRQSKSSMFAPGGWHTTSRVTPPPFFQGMVGRSAQSNRCQRME